MKLKILPCPFCSKTPTVQPLEGGPPTQTRVACENDACDVQPEVIGETEEEAYARWNTRPAEAPARKAIKHILDRIREHPQVGYYCGELTETFALLTDAAAVLFGEPVDKVRALFKPACPRK